MRTQTTGKIRLYVRSALTAGVSLNVDPAQAHYLGQVMRLKIGGSVLLFNGVDGEWRGRIETLGKKTATLTLVDQTRSQSDETASGPWLVFAPVKKTATDFIVEKATELGAARLLPMFTRHTASSRVNIERMTANAIEAAEQCERLSVPCIAEPASFQNLIAAWPADRTLLVLDETGGGEPIAQALEKMIGANPPERPAFYSIMTGPEGGFDSRELDALAKLPFVHKVGLGPRILRAETAALSALACAQAMIGDWRKAPRFRRNTESQ
ncbi:MAG: 16S rRNA (uracil(1498)-N(3))-methyltransferase [Rhodospirillales bacterium]|nr:16S rRNA (uracil(1498)-N(3))-methyltransferase [Rhodospirillales bacterium]